MKKIILAVCCIGLLSSCISRDDLSDNRELGQIITVIPTGTVLVEGCEYISLPGKYGFSHKGNCKNPIHSENR